MPDVTQLQFKLLSTEAQRAAVQRLALRGSSITEIAQRTGLTMQEVQSHLQSPLLSLGPVNLVPHWARPHSGNPRVQATAAL